MGPTVYSEASVINYHYSLRNNREDHCSLLRMQTGLTEVFYNDISKDFTHEDTVLTLRLLMSYIYIYIYIWSAYS